MTNPDLAALSAYADRRPQISAGERHQLAVKHAAHLPASPIGGVVGDADLDAMRAAFISRFNEDLPRTETLMAVANVGYRMALRDAANRSGDLVLIDREGMRDKCATSIHGMLSRANVTAYVDMPVETAGWCADAAIAAILGEVKP